MKKTLLLLAAFIPAISFAQQAFTIKGNLSKLKGPGAVFLLYQESSKAVMDSTKLINGSFTLKGSVKDPLKAMLILVRGKKALKDATDAEVLEVYLEKGMVTVKGTDSISKAVVTGGKANKDLQAWAKMNNNQPSASLETSLAFIRKNLSSWTSLDLIVAHSQRTKVAQIMEALFDSLSTELKTSVRGEEYAEIRRLLNAVKPGLPAPDFTGITPDGKQLKLSDFRGKIVLLDFWASWCKPCREIGPKLAEAYNLYKDKGVVILGVSMDKVEKKEAWLKAIEEDGITWPQVYDGKGFQGQIAKLYQIGILPQSALIDKDGTYISIGMVGPKLYETLDKLLAR